MKATATARETNVRIFPKQNENQNNQQQVGGGGEVAEGSGSTTTTQTLPVFDRLTRQNIAFEEIKLLFSDCFGRPMPRAISEQVLRAIRSGTPAYYFRYAIEETVFAPRPSWRYTMAIVSRLEREKASKADMYYRPTYTEEE